MEGCRVRVGLVEDNAVIGEMLQVGLKLSGNEVTLYTNAQDCISALLGARFNGKELPFDILVTDLDLGQGIDGAEMVRRLRQFIPPNDLQYMIMSGRDIIELNLLACNLLDIRILQKPITPTSLLKEMKRILGTTGAAS